MRSFFTIVAIAALAIGCAGSYEGAVRSDVDAYGSRFEFDPESVRATATATSPSNLSGYVARALADNPDVRAAFGRWRTSVLRISRARRLPEPTLGFGLFLRSVETRVGPQQARIGLSQTFPWPTKLSAGADAASAEARAAQRRFDAEALVVLRRVTVLYWRLWEIRQTQAIHRTHLGLMRSLADSVRGRIATGATSLADQQQIDLAVARVDDNIRGMDEVALQVGAELRAAIGGDAAPVDLPTPDEPPPVRMPVQTEASMIESVRAHPMLAVFDLMADAKLSSARASTADRFPSFTVGADWIITGEARGADVPDSGKDAVVLGAGIRVPLWQGSYADAAAADRAAAGVHRQEGRSALDSALARLAVVQSRVRDAVRRVKLYQSTLLPQAESAFSSVLGAYATGRGTVAATLLLQQDLLELRVGLDQARAEHARAFAELEEVTGRSLTRSDED